MALKDIIFAANDRPLRKVDVPEWGVSLWVKTWSARERMQVSGWKGANDLDARIVALSVVDEAGNPVFCPEDLPNIQNKSGVVVERLAMQAIEHNGIGQEPQAKN